MNAIRTVAVSVLCLLPAFPALAISIEEKASTLANCAAVYSISAQYVEAGGLNELTEAEKIETVKMLNQMGASALKKSFKYGTQEAMEKKFKSYSKVYADRVSKEGNTKALGPQLDPCKTLVNSSK